MVTSNLSMETEIDNFILGTIPRTIARTLDIVSEKSVFLIVDCELCKTFVWLLS